MQAQTRLNPSMEGGVGHKIPPLLGSDWQALAVGRGSLCFLKLECSPGQSTMLCWKSTCSRINEHYKLVLSKKEEKGHKVRWVSKEEVSLGRAGG